MSKFFLEYLGCDRSRSTTNGSSNGNTPTDKNNSGEFSPSSNRSNSTAESADTSFGYDQVYERKAIYKREPKIRTSAASAITGNIQQDRLSLPNESNSVQKLPSESMSLKALDSMYPKTI